MKKIFKHFSKLNKKDLHSKVGSTLIELIVTIAVLGIVSTISISSIFAMTNVAKKGELISQSQQIASILQKSFSLYGSRASDMQSLLSTDTKYVTPKAYSVADADGFMDKDNGTGDKTDYFIHMDSNHSVFIEKFDSSKVPVGYETLLKVDNVKSIEFTIKRLDGPSNKYVLEYTITTSVGLYNGSPFEYSITNGVVINNNVSCIGTTGDTPFILDGSDSKVLQIRSTSHTME